MLLHEAANQQRRQVIADGQRGADRKGAEAGLAVEQVFDLLGLVQQRNGLGQQLVTEGVEAQAFTGAVE